MSGPQRGDVVQPPHPLGRHGVIADTARANPGQWIVLGEYAGRSMVTQVRRGKLRAFRPIGAWDARAEVVDRLAGMSRIVITYRGDKK